MEKRKKEKIKTIVVSGIIFVLIGLCAALGVQAATNAQKVQFSMGTRFNPEFLVKTELKINGSFVEVFNSQTPVGLNNYIESISNDTLLFNSSNLTPTGATGIIEIKITSLADQLVRCVATCGNNVAATTPLILNTPQTLSVATGINASDGVNSTALGQISICLKFEAPTPLGVQFDSQGGTTVSSISVYQGMAYGTLPEPTKTGYGFGGWYTTSEFTTEVTSSSIVSSSVNHTLYAKWNPNIYKVTLDNQSATTAGTTEIYYKYNTSSPYYYYTNSTCTTGLSNSTITTPTKTNYTFLGYYAQTNGGGTQYINSSGECINNLYKAYTNNITLYANWQRVQYSVQFSTNGGSSVSSMIVDPGTTITLPTTTKSGYGFGGWYTDSACLSPFNSQTPINQNLTLYAYWSDYWNGTTASNFASGSGTSASPYLIRNASQLAYLMSLVNSGTNTTGKYYKLGNNIYLNNETFTYQDDGYVKVTDGTNTRYLGTGINSTITSGTWYTLSGSTYSVVNSQPASVGSGSTTWATNSTLYTWTGIGTLSNPFKGVFDGQLFSVNGFFKNHFHSNVTPSTTYASGLFSFTNSATIKNIDINGYHRYMVETNDEELSSSNYVGGIIGYSNSDNIEKCTSSMVVIGWHMHVEMPGGESYIGGICGYLESGVIKGCRSNSYVIVDYNSGSTNWGSGLSISAGGICGFGNGVVDNCYNYGEIISNRTTSSIGGLCGVFEDGVLLNCIQYGILTGNVYSVGGIVGVTYRPYNATTNVVMANCLYAGKRNASSTYESGAMGGYAASYNSIGYLYNSCNITTDFALGSNVGIEFGVFSPESACYTVNIQWHDNGAYPIFGEPGAYTMRYDDGVTYVPLVERLNNWVDNPNIAAPEGTTYLHWGYIDNVLTFID